MTGGDNGPRLPGDFMAELGRIQSLAAGLSGLLARAQQHAPAQATGADSSGAIQVVLGPDGLPEQIRVGSGWQRRLDPEAFGAAVGEAFTAASADRMEIWTRQLRDEGWVADVERRRGARDDIVTEPAGAPPPAFRPPPTGGTPRSLDLVTEDLLSAFGALDTHLGRAAAPAEGTGAAAAGQLTVTLSPAGGLSCTADPDWLSRVGQTTLAVALDEALAAARAELAAASAPDRDPAAGLDALFGEALAILDDPERLAGNA